MSDRSGKGPRASLRSAWILILALVAVGVGACSDEPDKNGDSDTALADVQWTAEVQFGTDAAAVSDTFSVADGNEVDTQVNLDGSDTADAKDPLEAGTSCNFDPFAPAGEPGAPCKEATDCITGLCIDTLEGKICSRPCQDCCPDGFACKQISTSSETLFVCTPRFAALCQPCLTDAECQATDAGALCVERPGQGHFCAGPCVSDSDCPTAYSCKEAEGEKGSAKQCLLKGEGECPCSAKSVLAGSSTSCSVSNTTGTCKGSRKCSTTGLTSCDAKTPEVESCNNIDDDCDGTTDEADAIGCAVWFLDEDKDGFGKVAGGCTCGPVGLATSNTNTDCNDNGAQVFPGAPEACNNSDDDCDGQTDEACDGDGDGWCSPGKVGGVLLAVCTNGLGDCDDANQLIKPGIPDLCGNGLDDNCDGVTDGGANVEGCQLLYADTDGDGYGAGLAACLCDKTKLYPVTNNADCNDGSVAISPSVTETCNNLDDNCDGQIDEDCDADGDGWCGSKVTSGIYLNVCPKGVGDCNDATGFVNPGRAELCGNNVDDDCDGATDFGSNPIGCDLYYIDGDKDTFGSGSPQCLCAPTVAFSATNSTDCNDSVAAINSAATETCNTVDDNCNGLVDEAGSTGCSQYYTDADKDGYSNGLESSCLCGPYSDYVTKLTGDCNDQVFASNPGATETCNGADDDCDGETDEADAEGCTVYYADNDKDLFGGASQCLCAKGAVYKLTVGGDCNDFDDSVAPESQEYCDGVDEDCDGLTDEQDSFGCDTYYNDVDNDGYGDSVLSYRCLCGVDGSWKVLVAGDCNDADVAVNPAGTESCNGADDDCDLTVDPAGSGGCLTYYRDNDGDSYGTSQTQCLCAATAPYTASNADDCNDGLKLVNPAGTETCNGIDDNCNSQTDEGMLGTVWPDSDGDGFGATTGSIQACGVPGGYSALSGDCNDGVGSINPGITIEACDGIDNNCNNMIDEGTTPPIWFQDGDGDGYGKPGTAVAQCLNPGGHVQNADDCNDGNGAIKPGATETCNSVDDNCSGTTDEGLPLTTYYEDKDADTYGNPAVSKSACSAQAGFVTNNTDCNDNSNVIKPTQTETCDQVDQDCDGSTDEGLTKSTYYLDADNDGSGASSPTVQACAKPAGYASSSGDCNDNNNQVNPLIGFFTGGVYYEDSKGCNGIDNDCNGYTDDGNAWPHYQDLDGDGYGNPAVSVSACFSSPPSGYVRDGSDCNDTAGSGAAIHPNATDTPGNGIDEDCTGADLSPTTCSNITYADFETGSDGFSVGSGWTWDYYYEACVLFCSGPTIRRRLAFADNDQSGYPTTAGATTMRNISIPNNTKNITFTLWFKNWIDYDNDDYDNGIYLEFRVGTSSVWTKYGPFNYGHSSSSTDRTYSIPSTMWGTNQSIQFRVVSPNGSSDSWEGIFIDNVRSVCN